jgi:hypothetical protein
VSLAGAIHLPSQNHRKFKNLKAGTYNIQKINKLTYGKWNICGGCQRETFALGDWG